MGFDRLHTPITRRMAREVLPPGACRRCVRIARYLPVLEDRGCEYGIFSEGQSLHPGVICDQCGVRYDPAAILAVYEARGWIDRERVKR